MVKVKVFPHAVLCPVGLEFEASSGENLCRALLNAGIKIEHACEMSCACTTCHVIIQSGANSLQSPEEQEDDLLDKAWGLKPSSRLSCQVYLEETDLAIEIPRYTLNHARE